MGRNFSQGRGFSKSHILFLCLAIIVITYAFLTKEQNQSAKTQVHKIDSLYESYNKPRAQVRKGGEKSNNQVKITKKVNDKVQSLVKSKTAKAEGNQQAQQVKKAQQMQLAQQAQQLQQVHSEIEARINPYQILKVDKVQDTLNRKTNNRNILVYWVDGNNLKVLSILSINEANKKMAVITVPLFGQFLYQDRVMTIGDYYKQNGRRELTNLLEKLLEVKLENYVLVQQQTLEQISSMVGAVRVNGENLYIAKAFEQTAAGLRKDDQDIVRALGSKLVSSTMWLKIPKLVWLFSSEVETNLTGKQLWDIYKAAKGMEVGKLNKKPIFGIDYVKEGKEYRVLLARIYKNIIYDLTR